jgi:anti-anti-sigma factor
MVVRQAHGIPNGRPKPGTVEVGHHARGLAYVCLRGEHDLSSAEIVKPALETAVANASVMVDLSACTFIDSTVITWLIRAAKTAEQRSERFVLVIPPDQAAVARAAEMTQLGEIIPIYTSQQAALWSLQQPPLPQGSPALAPALTGPVHGG